MFGRAAAAVSSLRWALVTPTYRRADELLLALRRAAEQDLPPSEIVVVDASPDHERTRQLILANLAPRHSGIEWKLLPALRRSSSAQRNQGLDAATADVVFLFDDDTHMYPGCARAVMSVYERDAQGLVAGVMPALSGSEPGDRETGQPIRTASPPKERSLQLRYRIKRWLGEHDIFIPYDFEYHRVECVPALQGLDAHTVPMMHGARMTFRRRVTDEIRFEQAFVGYAVHEDNDVCYRASRRGALVQLRSARVFHRGASGGRVPTFLTTSFWGLNLCYLHRRHGSDPVRFERLFRRLLRQRIASRLLRDVLDRRPSLPSVRGLLFARRHFPTIMRMPLDELAGWYPEFQSKLLAEYESVSFPS